MSIELVIARYNEDLSWLEKVPKHIQITIYNKGADDLQYPCIYLPNVGRESHTYLYHIINNYEDLAHRTIFCQGDTIFHSPEFIDLLHNAEKFEDMQPLSAYYWKEGEPPYYFSNPPTPLLEETRNLWINNNPVHVEYMDNNFTTRFPHLYFEHYFVRLNEYVSKQYNVNNIFQFWTQRFRLPNVDLDELFPVCYAGIFSVDKHVILDNSVDFYNNIMNSILYDIRMKDDSKQFDIGLYLEKLWLVIFNYKKYNKNYVSLKIKDYPYYNEKLNVVYENKKSKIEFSLYNVVSQIYLEFFISQKKYRLYLSQHNVLLKTGKQTVYKSPDSMMSILIQRLPFKSYLTISICLYKNKLEIYTNDIPLVKIKNINKDIDNDRNVDNKITSAEIFTLTTENKFHDLLDDSFIPNKYTIKNKSKINSHISLQKTKKNIKQTN